MPHRTPAHRAIVSKAAAALAAGLLVAAPTAASAADPCYRLPFSNPNLADGWGSTAGGRTNPHRGLDFPQAANTPIPVVADGVVRLVTSTGCLGNVMVVEHADGHFSGYAHLIRKPSLAVGTRVTRGQTIANVGTTGTCTTGNHLHLTIAPTLGGYASGVTLDPYKFIEARKECTPPAPSVPPACADGGPCEPATAPATGGTSTPAPGPSSPGTDDEPADDGADDDLGGPSFREASEPGCGAGGGRAPSTFALVLGPLLLGLGLLRRARRA